MSSTSVARAVSASPLSSAVMIRSCCPAPKAGDEAKRLGQDREHRLRVRDHGIRLLCCLLSTKAAVIMLTKTLVFELAPHGVNINSIGP
ncbi:hypothetical protein [Burkholderia cepacia]|uniref:hypothetical protein n=1 Tax=Burkholderia cepacia TaxID=292 RepID=UPI001576EBC5|nr:hypothetical protein [Burkholderia cepacia]NTX24703.1 hypothetical protein [Burkholderia cepacia]